MSQIQSITDVVTALNFIVTESARKKSCAGYFAALYKRVTMAVQSGIEKGEFDDGKRMEQLDIIFANRYLTAFNAFQSKAQCSASWQCALTGCNNPSLVVLQHLLLGINTHINLDLAIAAALVAPGENIHALENDFNKINLVIASLVDDVQSCLEEVWFPMRWLNKVGKKPEEAVLNFSIGIARHAAWNNALKLARMNAEEQALQIKTMDATVQQIGNAIIHPGFWPQVLLKFIRFTEYNDVARTIELIDKTVVE